MNNWRVFDSLFFLLHQARLLWLLNAPVIGRWFRWCMRIRCWDIGSREIISSIGPNFFTVPLGFTQRGEAKYRTDFRSHAKFSKRLYYAFSPVWWAMHAWDWCVADRWVPELSFGFDTLTKYPDADPETNTVDGEVDHYIISAGGTWATMVAGAGVNALPSATTEAFIWFESSSTTNQWRGLGRSIFLFDNSSLTSAAVISVAVLSLWGTSKLDGNSATPNIDIYTSTPASNTDLVPGDYAQIGSVSQTGSPISYSSYSVSSYNAFTFNATGRGNINKTGISKFGARNSNYDVAETPPAWVSNAFSYLNGYYADQTGTDNDPKLVVTYTFPAVITGTATSGFTENDVIASGDTIIITLGEDTFIS